MGLSNALIIVGGITLFVFFSFFWILDMFGISLDDDEFIATIVPYFLLIGLATLAGGFGIKIYHRKRSSS